MRRLSLLLLILLPLKAAANGAMGLGLEMFHFGYWCAYVVTIVGIEAWAIGRWAGASWLRSTFGALGANAITALCCPLLAAPALHGPLFGSRLNPNPFINVLALMALFGFLSAFFETIVWSAVLHPRSTKSEFQLTARGFLVHFATIPLALGILLFPDRPYIGLEYSALNTRRNHLILLRAELQDYVDTHKRLPPGENLEEVIRFLKAAQPDGRLHQDSWAVPYSPSFGRFAMGEDRSRVAYEWNTAFSGKPTVDAKGQPLIPNDTWLVRSPWGIQPYRTTLVLTDGVSVEMLKKRKD